MADDTGILFTAFEPSGDAVAAAMIAELRRLRPGVKVWALGGPRMQAAGAELLENTTSSAAMLLGAVSQWRSHRRWVGRVRAWLGGHRIAALVAVDSPAANWSMCRLVRRRQPGARIVHLVAPQVWAWAPWRVGKLRRLTDRVLCLLPFEPAWFERRGVPAVFVGHPLFERGRGASAEAGPGQVVGSSWDDRRPRIALLPGSRVAEIRANWPTMLRVVNGLRLRYPRLAARVAAIDERAAGLVRSIGAKAMGSGCLPEAIEVVVGRADEVIDWSEVVVTVSGTATLQVAAHRRPMVVVYRVGWWSWQLVGRWLVRARTFALPNLIEEGRGSGRVVPEFVPHFGGARPVVEEVRALIERAERREAQVRGLERVAGAFEGREFGRCAAGALVELIEGSGTAGGGRGASPA